MKGLIHCAGLGTRLRPITNTTPKPMVEVAGHPVLEHLVYHLHKYDITRIMVNLHYLPLKIMEHFGTTLLYSYEPTLLGEEGTIDSLSDWMKDDFTVVMNGDTLTDINLADMFSLADGRSIKSMDGLVYTGCQIVSPDYFNGDKKFVTYYNSELYWQDMGTPEGLKKARKHYEKARNLSKLSN